MTLEEAEAKYYELPVHHDKENLSRWITFARACLDGWAQERSAVINECARVCEKQFANDRHGNQIWADAECCAAAVRALNLRAAL